MTVATALLDALAFAARKHRDQRRKDAEASPFINHPIGVAHVLAAEGAVTDPAVLVAANLPDKISTTRHTTDPPPADWSAERRLAYLDWASQVVNGCRGVNPGLEAAF